MVAEVASESGSEPSRAKRTAHIDVAARGKTKGAQTPDANPGRSGELKDQRVGSRGGRPLVWLHTNSKRAVK